MGSTHKAEELLPKNKQLVWTEAQEIKLARRQAHRGENACTDYGGVGPSSIPHLVKPNTSAQKKSH